MESLEELHVRHRKEQKDLQSRITQKKKSATKKTRKGVNSECEELERQVKERQEQERAALEGESLPENETGPKAEEISPEESTEASTNGVNSVAEALSRTTISTPEPPASENGQPRKRNRAKERLARRAAEQEAAVEEAKKEAANQPDRKAIEKEKMQEEFMTRGLVERLIRPDGHCLFSAVADQLTQAGIPLGADIEGLKEGEGYKTVRKAAASYIEGHPSDFAGFLDEPLQQYAEKIRNTAEWGGHLELLALAKTYNIEICVIRDGSSHDINPGLETHSEPKKIWLAYYEHGFGLGEHYNSLRKAS